MTLFLEYRDKIKKFYRLNAVVILPVLKFMLAFFALNGVNTMMGYMPRLDNLAIVLIASLACSFLPAGCLVLLCTLFSLGHMYAMSMETLLVGGCVYLLLFLLLLRFSPRDSYVVVLTPLLFALKIPYVVPVAVGLLGSPLSAISVACGVLVYYLLNTIVASATTISTMGEKEYLDKVRFLLEAILKNKAALVVAGAFAVTVIVVYLLRRLSVEHAWTIAMVAGAMINLVLLLVGDLKYNIGLSMGSAILGSVLAVLVAKVIEFFRFCVDYGRTEWVQFEDDDYYYYVKAVPKMNIAAATKTVKRIHTNTQSIPPVGERTKGSGEGTRVSSAARPASQSHDRAGETAGQSRERVRETAGQSRERVRETAGQSRERVRETAGQSRERVRETAGQSQQRAGGMTARGSEVPGETRAMTPVGNAHTKADGRGRIRLQEDDTRLAQDRMTRPGTGMNSGGGSYGASAAADRSRASRSYVASSSRGSQTTGDDSDDSDDYEELF